MYNNLLIEYLIFCFFWIYVNLLIIYILNYKVYIDNIVLLNEYLFIKLLMF